MTSTMSKGRTGGDVVHEALLALEVTTVFVVASVHNLPILDAIHRGGRLRVVNVRHEQNAVHAADGFSRATGQLGVAITSTGPGAANAMGGLFEASFASSRVLMITGQVETRFLGQGRGFLHEAEHQREMLRSLTRETWSVRRTEDLGDAVVAAGRAAGAGRPTPTAVEIPVDLQYAPTNGPAPSASPVRATAPRSDRIEEAAALLHHAHRPLIWAGGGVVAGDATEALRHLAERLRIPVVTSTQGRGALPEDHPLALGAMATAEPIRGLLEDADVVLAVGTRFQMYPTGFWTVRMPGSLIHADVDASVIGRSYAPTVSVVGDARLVLEALDRSVMSTAADRAWTQRAIDAGREARRDAVAHLGPDHSRLVGIIRRHLPAGGAVVRDSTVPAYQWGDSLLPVITARTSINPASGSIGPGLPLALGATLGRDVRSVVIHGDGGIMLSIQELVTLAQFEVPLTVLVFNDGGYGILRGIQAATFGDEPHDVDLLPPDFVALAASMHVPGRRVGSVEEFERAFADSVAARGPYLIEIDLRALAPTQIPIAAQELLG